MTERRLGTTQKVFDTTIDQAHWIAACEEGYEALAAAFNRDYDWIGHFEFIAMTIDGDARWIASGHKGPLSYYAMITVRSNS